VKVLQIISEKEDLAIPVQCLDSTNSTLIFNPKVQFNSLEAFWYEKFFSAIVTINVVRDK